MKLQISGGMWKFAKKAAETWGLKPWDGEKDPDDVLFFGMYSQNDYDILRNAEVNKKTKKYIFWCGSDIIQMLQSWDRQRVIKMYPDIQHYTETEQEGKELRKVAKNVIVAPSFLEPVEKFKVCFKPSKTPHIYLSGHQNREEEYGFDLCKEIAEEHPEFIFHFYGVEGRNTNNVFYHGWVDNNQFNEEIKEFQCGLRCNAHDGFSEIIVKSALMGQYPISLLPYRGVLQFKDKETLVEQLKKVAQQTEPNLKAREYWLPRLNSYPWMEKYSEEDWKVRGVSGQKEIDESILVDKIEQLGAKSALDVGFGAGGDLRLLRKRNPDMKLAGIDISQKAVDSLKLEGVETILGNADNLPFEDNSFDVVYTNATLIDIRPDKIEKVRDELLRVAKKAIILVEFHLEDFGKLGRIALRHWTRNYQELFSDQKVEIKKITNHMSWKWNCLAHLITIKL